MTNYQTVDPDAAGAAAILKGNKIFTPTEVDFAATKAANPACPKEKFFVGNLIAASGRKFSPGTNPVILDWALIDCTNTTRSDPLLTGKKYKINQYPVSDRALVHL